MLYLHIVLTDIGYIEAVVISKAHKKMAVFLAFTLDLFDHANPTFQRSTKYADGIIFQNEVIISLINNTQSLYAICHFIAEIDKMFHVFIWNRGIFYNSVQV